MQVVPFNLCIYEYTCGDLQGRRIANFPYSIPLGQQITDKIRKRKNLRLWMKRFKNLGMHRREISRL